MGCTWISVVSLAVLILASFLANMKTGTQASDLQSTTGITELPAMLSTDQPESGNRIVEATSELLIVNCSVDPTLEKIYKGENQNASKIYNCSYLESTQATMTDESFEKDQDGANSIQFRTYRDFSEYEHYKNMEKVIPYVSTIPGFFTNTLTIFIGMKIRPKHTSEIYMIVLGCTDLLAVISRFTGRVVRKNVDSIPPWLCRAPWYILTVAQVYSNFILMSWTVERFIAVIFPIKLGVWCSIRNTKITLFCLLMIALVLTVPYITELDSRTFWNGRVMVTVCQFSEFMYSVWTHIESIYYVYLPMSVVLVCNLVILSRLNAMMKARIDMSSNKETIDKKAQENRRMTVLLLVISGTFLFLHIPYVIALVVSYYYPDLVKLSRTEPHTLAKYLLYTNMAFAVTEFQNSINFFLYCLAGSKFRQTFRRTVCFCFPEKQLDTLQSSRTNTTKI